MEYKILLCMLLIYSAKAKEEIDEESVAQLTDDLLHEIEKRIQDDPSAFDSLLDTVHLFEKKCEHTTTNNSIIKTDSSLENGAIFLGTPEVKSYDDCLEACCDTESCNVAIFKGKMGSLSCYLFDCGEPSVCEFTEHENYYLINVQPSPDKIAEKHENDLDNLAIEETSTSTSTTTTTTTTTTEAPRMPSPLFGTCRDEADCAGSSTICVSGYCVCQTGYHPQAGICRKDCSRFQFECKNEGNPQDDPQCIAIYDRCDGIQHCHDNSDELECEDSLENNRAYPPNWTPPPEKNKEQPPPEKNKEQDQSKQVSVVPTDTIQSENHIPSESEQNEEEQKSHKLLTPVSNSNNDNTHDSSAEVVDMENNSPESDKSTEKPKPEEQPNEEHNSQAAAILPVESNDNMNNDKNKTLNSDDSSVVIQEDLVIVKEITRPSNRTAVVALSLGLIITALLLLFVGCRLRNVRKRLRKGRPMNSNEADYLINGMYL